jgi:hypothetical protein
MMVSVQDVPKLQMFFPTFQPLTRRLKAQKFLKMLCSSFLDNNISASIKILHGRNQLTDPLAYPKFLSRQPMSGNKWVSASIKFQPNQLTNQELVDNLLLLIGIPLFLPTLCAVCKKSPTTDHFSGKCAQSAHSGPNRITSEKAAWQALQLLGASTTEKQPVCELMPQWEPTAYHLSLSATNPSIVKKKGDILIQLGARIIMVDVVCSNNFSIIPNKDLTTPFALCNLKEKAKYGDYLKHFKFPRTSFCPFAFDFHGGLGVDTSNLINEIHGYSKASGHVDPNSLHFALCKISIATCRMVTCCAEICRKNTSKTNTS